jgi:hypothetical protein
MCERKEGTKSIDMSIFFVFYRRKSNMLLNIIFLGLITNLALVSGDSEVGSTDVGTTKLNNLDRTRLAIGVLTGLM